MPSLHSLPPEEAYRLACEMSETQILGPWTKNSEGDWYRERPPQQQWGFRTVMVWRDKAGKWRGGDAWHKSARAAMQAADEQLRASGAILCGDVPGDVT